MTGPRIVGNWELEQPIGSGSFAVVWRAHHIRTGKMAAVKEINTDKLNRKLQESLASEIAVLQQVQQRNIVGFQDLIKEPGRIHVVLEYCGGGDLGHYLRHYQHVSEDTARYFMLQLAEGLKTLRAHNVIHRDLKPQNLLLSDTSKQPLLKIADFGFARGLEPQGLAETLCGSPLYMAPEILQFHKYDAKADLWSVGTILFELLAGKPPFNGANHLQLLQNIERYEAKIPDHIAVKLSAPCIQLVHQLLRRNPVERISFEEFFVHPNTQQVQRLHSNATADISFSSTTADTPPSSQQPSARQPQPQPQQSISANHNSPHAFTSPASTHPPTSPPNQQRSAPISPPVFDLTHSKGGLFMVPLSQQLSSPSPPPIPNGRSLSSRPESASPSTADPPKKEHAMEDSFDLDYVVVSPPCSSHVSESAPQPHSGRAMGEATRFQATHFQSRQAAQSKAEVVESHSKVQQAPSKVTPPSWGSPSAATSPVVVDAGAMPNSMELIVRLPEKIDTLDLLQAHPSAASSPVAVDTGEVPNSMELIVRLSEKIDTLDLLQRVIMVLMESAPAGPLGSSTLDSAAVEAAVIAAGASQAELVGLYLYCNPNPGATQAELVALHLYCNPNSGATQAELVGLYLYCSRMLELALSLTTAIEDRLLSQRDPKQANAPVPEGVDMVRAAAVDELMCHFASSIEQYAKAADLLLFLLVDVPAVSEIKPKLGLADEQRIYKYYAAVKMRQCSCMAAFNSSMAKEMQQVNLS
eukprot:gene22284-29361_t